jgi:hypothetical protein
MRLDVCHRQFRLNSLWNFDSMVILWDLSEYARECLQYQRFIQWASKV